MSREPIIRVENVSHTYLPSSREPIQALRGVSLTIYRGEYVAIIGHNGSGKSTLARHLNGLLLPTEGTVWVGEWDTQDPRHRRDVRSTVGMVFQSPDNQIVATIVEEDVAFGPENLGVPRPTLRTRVDEALDTVGMQAFRHRAPHLLSGGQKQRVALAGVLAMQPQVLVLDESTALLDPEGRQDVLEVARRLNRDGVTIVAITHFMHEAALADRIFVMNEGQIGLEGTPKQVFRQAERLHELRLDVPEVTQLALRLHARDESVPVDVLTVTELADAVRDRRPPTADGGPLTDDRKSLTADERLPTAEVDSESTRDNGRSAVSRPRSLPPQPDLVISARGLQHTYLRGTPLESIALKNVDMDVQREQVVGIIGPTGSGKSTLIQHLNGLLRPQQGEMRVLDFDLASKQVDTRALLRRVGLVFQFPEAQLFEQYLGDDVAFGPWQTGMRGKDLSMRVREAMEAVGLPFETFKDRPLHSLSGGEKRRAALAGVLANKPEVLVLDEPTAGLDPRGHQDILERIMALRDKWGTTLVIVSHNMEEIARLCDQVYVLVQGETVLNGTPRQVFSEPERLASLGLRVPQVTEVMRALRDRGLDVAGDALTLDEAEAEIARVWAQQDAPDIATARGQR